MKKQVVEKLGVLTKYCISVLLMYKELLNISKKASVVNVGNTSSQTDAPSSLTTIAAFTVFTKTVPNSSMILASFRFIIKRYQSPELDQAREHLPNINKTRYSLFASKLKRLSH